MKYLEIAKSCGAVPHREYDSVTGSYYEYGDIVITEQQLHAYTEQVCKQSMQGEAVASIIFNENEEHTLLPLGREVFKLAQNVEHPLYTHAPNDAKTIAELQAENEALRKDANM